MLYRAPKIRHFSSFFQKIFKKMKNPDNFVRVLSYEEKI